jgi:hypothetical protein
VLGGERESKRRVAGLGEASRKLFRTDRQGETRSRPILSEGWPTGSRKMRTREDLLTNCPPFN